MLQAAIAGLEVAIGLSLLIQDDIRRGLLVWIGPPVRVAAAYWLVTKPELATSSAMQSFGMGWMSKSG